MYIKKIVTIYIFYTDILFRTTYVGYCIKYSRILTQSIIIVIHYNSFTKDKKSR